MVDLERIDEALWAIMEDLNVHADAALPEKLEAVSAPEAGSVMEEIEVPPEEDEEAAEEELTEAELDAERRVE